MRFSTGQTIKDDSTLCMMMAPSLISTDHPDTIRHFGFQVLLCGIPPFPVVEYYHGCRSIPIERSRTLS